MIIKWRMLFDQDLKLWTNSLQVLCLAFMVPTFSQNRSADNIESQYLCHLFWNNSYHSFKFLSNAPNFPDGLYETSATMDCTFTSIVSNKNLVTLLICQNNWIFIKSPNLAFTPIKRKLKRHAYPCALLSQGNSNISKFCTKQRHKELQRTNQLSGFRR